MSLPVASTNGTYASAVGSLPLEVSFPAGSSGVFILNLSHNPSPTQVTATYTFPTSMFSAMFTATGNQIRHFLYIRKADGSTTEATSTSVTITISGGTSGVRHSVQIHRITNATTEWEGEGAAFGATTSCPAPDATALGSSRLALAVAMIGSAAASTSFSGETGGDWTLALSSSGNSPALCLQSAGMASSGTITGGSFGLSSSFQTVSGGFCLPSATPGVSLASVSIFESAVFSSPMFGRF